MIGCAFFFRKRSPSRVAGLGYRLGQLYRRLPSWPAGACFFTVVLQGGRVF
jgi:hypothetical protein